MTVTVELAGADRPHLIQEVEQLVGRHQLYRKGTNPEQYFDCRDRAEADLVVINLNLVLGVKARILGDRWM